MKPDHSAPPTVAKRFGSGTSIRHIDRRLLVIRIRETSLRWIAMPALAVFAAVFFSRIAKTGGLFDIRTAGLAATVALTYGMLRAERRRLLKEAEDLERARSPIPPSEAAREFVEGI